MSGRITALYRHPVKGFTPEALDRAALTPGAGIAHDRIYAVEDGPSGFDPNAPAHIPKMRFTVLAKIPAVARVRTRYDDARGVLHAETPDAPPLEACLAMAEGRSYFANWLSEILHGQIRGPLRVIPGPGAHRFYDNPTGFISLINLASVHDIEQKLRRPVDPLRFRANLYVEGWPAWSELELVNQAVSLGPVQARVVQPIRRCLATHVDPASGVRDIDMLETLQREYGHALCGVYLDVENGGDVRAGDSVRLAG